MCAFADAGALVWIGFARVSVKRGVRAGELYVSRWGFAVVETAMVGFHPEGESVSDRSGYATAQEGDGTACKEIARARAPCLVNVKNSYSPGTSVPPSRLMAACEADTR
jgi:hypothetical protein